MKTDASRFDPKIDLATCEQEPIHIPGAIQPHGVLLAVREPDLLIRQVSANVAEWLGTSPGEVLDHPLDQVLDPASVALVREALASRHPSERNPLPLTAHARAFDGLLHRAQGLTLLELEPASRVDAGELYRSLNLAMARLRQANGLLELCQVAASEVKRLTAFDRVLVYRFDSEDNGEVLAEERDAALEPFLGLHFPASDIPRQARALYLVNGLRLIPDRTYRPAPLMPPRHPDTGAPTDLSRAALRSVSPLHLEYMANMGVRASMSVSIIVEGRLWGLISCGHREPKYVPYAVRAACETLGRLLSLEIRAREARALAGARAPLPALYAFLAEAMHAEEETLVGLVKGSPSVIDLIPAEGAAVYLDGRLETVGRTPAPAQLQTLARWLQEKMRGELFHTASLARVFPEAEAYHDVASGLLAFSLPTPAPHLVLWFRPEVLQTVSWGGDPRKPVEDDGDAPRPHPRRSFARWQETVRRTAVPWTPLELETARELRRHAVEVNLAREVMREQAAHAEAEAERRRVSFISEAGVLLSSSLDYESTLAHLAQLATARFCDLCVIDLLGEDGRLHRAQVRHAEASLQPVADKLYDFPPREASPQHPSKVIERDQSLFLPEVDAAYLRAIARDEAHFELLHQKLQIRSVVSVPLSARGRVLGVAVFINTRTSRRGPLAPSDLTVAEELGRRAAAAVDNARLYREAQQAITEAQTAVRARDDLMAVVSHDLRNPLNVIQLQSALIRRTAPSDAGPPWVRVSQATERIQRSVEKMNALIGDLLDLAKIEAGRFAVELRPEPVDALLDDAMELLRPLAEQKGLTLTAAVEAPELKVHADRERVFRVLSNLVGNAIKFTPAKGSIRVAVAPVEGEARFSVTDTGPGIAAELLPHIFARYWQAKASGREGVGLGLSIAKGIVEAHGGRIWVESQPGHGTTFFFTLRRA